MEENKRIRKRIKPLIYPESGTTYIQMIINLIRDMRNEICGGGVFTFAYEPKYAEVCYKLIDLEDLFNRLLHHQWRRRKRRWIYTQIANLLDEIKEELPTNEEIMHKYEHLRLLFDRLRKLFGIYKPEEVVEMTEKYGFTEAPKRIRERYERLKRLEKIRKKAEELSEEASKRIEEAHMKEIKEAKEYERMIEELAKKLKIEKEASEIINRAIELYFADKLSSYDLMLVFEYVREGDYESARRIIQGVE